MVRRLAIATLWCAALSAVAATNVPGISIRGKLTKSSDGKPIVVPSTGKPISVEGDDATVAVLNDQRLAGADFEAIGHFTSPDHFIIDPITSRAMFVHKNGKRLMITYWCDVCYIRTYTPGVCWCCQKYTDLDLRESDDQ